MTAKDPIGMIPDPYAGDSFVFPETPCTNQRRLWFKRANEIFGFLMLTELAIKECRSNYEKIATQKNLKSDTPFKIKSSDGRSIVTPLSNLLAQLDNNIDVLCRQIFIMFYGSLETYLYEILEQSFIEIGKTEDVLQSSKAIMIGANWDGKFCKIRDTFEISYKANNLKQHFNAFEMDFEGKKFKNPLLFLDELAQIRHKIIHASSLLEKGKLIYINAQLFHPLYGFCFLLTDYIDELFSKRFGFDRVKINPAHA